MAGDPLDVAPTPARLRALRGVLSPTAWGAVAEAARRAPPPDAWREALSLGLALLGAGLLGAAAIYAVAFNWQAMDTHVRLALPIVATTACAVGGRLMVTPPGSRAPDSIRFDRLGGLVLLSLACVGVGASLLVYGQTYQTGADAWQLFATWGVLILPWVLLARFAPLTLAGVLLVNVAFGTFWEVHDVLPLRSRELAGGHVATLLNGAMLFLWERHGARLRAGEGRFGQRALGILTLAPATFSTWWCLLESQRMLAWAVGSIALMLAVAALFVRVYGRPGGRSRDLFQVTLVAIAIASCVLVGSGRLVVLVFEWNPFTVLLMAGVALGLAVGTANWLRRLHRAGNDLPERP